jgi:predicted ATP-grasp superfamily ATP-dependent carboligase
MQPSVVVTGFGPTSLGIVRCLAGSGRRATAIGIRRRGYKIPLLYSRLPAAKVVIPHGTDIVDALVELRPRFDAPPFLLLAEDAHVVAVSERRDRLEDLYRFVMPSHDLVSTLMDKKRFADLARERGFRIPETVTLAGPEGVPALLERLDFPFVVKPYLRHAQVVHDERELRGFIESLKPRNWEAVVVQEWIPGDASTLWFCLAYLDDSSRCLAHVTGQKVRLWPPGSGNSSICRTAPNERVARESIDMLESLGVTGFASVEYKYDRARDAYLVLEPTIGRCDQQIALTAAAGVNVPAIGLDSMISGAVPDAYQRDGVTWIWELWDLFARWHPRQDNRSSHVRAVLAADVRMLTTRRDPGPVVSSFGSLFFEGLGLAGSRLMRSFR